MEDNTELVKSLTAIYQFSNEQMDALLAKIKVRILDKGDYLLKEGQICDFLAFVETGSLRFYTLTDGDEMTLHFFTEYQWMTDYESLTSHSPSANNLQATEKTVVKLITLDNLHVLLEEFPVFRNMMKVLDKGLITSTHLASVTAATSPDERYAKLLNTYPGWINRFPQMHIASYLGMTKETFSRVKARVK